MPGRLARTVAIVLLFVEGLSGASVGLTLLIGVAGVAGLGSSIAVPLGVLAYGVALVAGGIGILLGRRWGWPLATIVVLLGLGVLVVLLAVVGFDDPVLLGGVAIWAITLVALLASWRQPGG